MAKPVSRRPRRPTRLSSPSSLKPQTLVAKALRLAGGASPQARVVINRPLDHLNPYPNNPRSHPDKQIETLKRGIIKFGCTTPILIDEYGTILAGHGRVEAARRAGLKTVPTLTLGGLTEAEKKAYVIFDNRIGEQSTWDLGLLRMNLDELVTAKFDVELTGFDAGQVDLLIDGDTKPPADADKADDVPPASEGLPVTVTGDVWDLGPHRLLCGDARDPAAYVALLGTERVQMVFTDPPYNVRIDGNATGKGRVRHREFAHAAGEMSAAQFTAFLAGTIGQAAAAAVDGAILFICMDWRHLRELDAAAAALGLDQKNLIVWVKTNAGMGSFYRSGHELIVVYKVGAGKHINNFGLGKYGRYRTNVWTYPSVNSLHPARRDDLALHPTVKPVALVADAMRDCSKRNGMVLDPFGGSGTTILAAERTGRIARVIEIDPAYVDVAIRRWEQVTGKEARHARTGLTFAETAAARQAAPLAVQS